MNCSFYENKHYCDQSPVISCLQKPGSIDCLKSLLAPIKKLCSWINKDSEICGYLCIFDVMSRMIGLFIFLATGHLCLPLNCVSAFQSMEGHHRRIQRAADKVVLIATVDEQTHKILEARLECEDRMKNDPRTIQDGLYCNRTWDNIMCWPDTTAGHTWVQSCPAYINMFRKDAYASRQCLDDGTWFVHPGYNRSWTNFSLCAMDSQPTFKMNDMLKAHIVYIKTVSHIGYGLSVVTLVVATFVTLYFRKLRCPRNSLHVNLFLSFIFRAMMSFMRESLFVAGLGLPKDVIRSENNTVVFRNDVSHWECRLLMAVFNYAMATNYTWIFVEGLYIHTLIFVSISENSSIKWYTVFGWSVSLLFVIPWVIVRATLENIYCWNTHDTPAYFWIIKTPVVITVVINFVFFINIVRVLFTKLNAANTPESRKHRHRTLAKSTLVLIPLFGVPYIIFLGLPDNMNETAEMVKLYFEMTFNSFNGFVVALLFCFMNGEVQLEFKKRWQRYKLQKMGGTSNQPHHSQAGKGHDKNVTSRTALQRLDNNGTKDNARVAPSSDPRACHLNNQDRLCMENLVSKPEILVETVSKTNNLLDQTDIASK